MIKTIRELTGLSYEGLGAWLGVSKSMVQFVERGERSLRGDAYKKLIALTAAIPKLLQQAEAARQVDPINITNAEAYAKEHKYKMEHHRHQAIKLQNRLDKLKLLQQKLTTRFALLQLMKEMQTELYKNTEQDDHMAGLLEFFGQDHLKHIIPKLAPLQNSIDMHLAYAAAHGQMQAKYEAMLA